MPSNLGQPPYKVYRSGPRGLRERLRGEEETLLGPPGGPGPEYQRYSTGRGWRERFRRRGAGEPGAEPRKRITPGRVIKWLVVAVVAWLVLSLALFMISAQTQQSGLPASATAALSSGGNMLFSPDTILIMGTDQRPRTGPGSKEPGSNYNDAGSRTDTLMLWRLGGGTSRRLSIPRDTAVNIPGHGIGKINAAYALGGPALTIKTVEAFTGLKINHAIIVNLADFVPFINAIGGIDVKTEHVCAQVSGGPSHGGFALNLSPGVHHLNGLQALLYSRIRENPCNPADSDLTRVQHQQEVLNAIKARLLSPSTFIRLPIASWDAPKVLRSDMGGLTLMSLFIASEMGGSAPVQVLKPTGSEYLPAYGDALTVDQAAVHNAVNRLINGG
ncbi:MAG TPA: LCP family protein [Solirubrobacteraceae bacterium]|nr:LCP family protein [Solirubrobacteraceae bacterium]